jgi:hypothetical protein
MPRVRNTEEQKKEAKKKKLESVRKWYKNNDGCTYYKNKYHESDARNTKLVTKYINEPFIDAFLIELLKDQNKLDQIKVMMVQ